MDTFRKVYTPLTDGQKAEMDTIKTQAEALEASFNTSLLQGADPLLIATAKTYLEITILLAVKAVTNDRTTLVTASQVPAPTTEPTPETIEPVTTPTEETTPPPAPPVVLNTGEEPSPADQPVPSPVNENPPTPIDQQPPSTFVQTEETPPAQQPTPENVENAS